MADPPVEINVDVEVPLQNQQQNRNGNGRAQAQSLFSFQNNTFGVVRDRLFHAMLVKVALSYSSHVSTFWRRVIEFVSLLIAVCLLFTLLFVHLMFTRSSTTCLDHLRDSWPRDGKFHYHVHYFCKRNEMTCYFNPVDVLLYGPRAIPAEVRAGKTTTLSKAIAKVFLKFFPCKKKRVKLSANSVENVLDDSEPEDAFRYEYRVEYSLLYGILRLPVSFRNKHNISTLWTRVDADSECFGDAFSRRVMRAVLGYEDVVMASLRALAHNLSEDGLGYLHDLSTNEHYHFVSFIMSKSSYITAAIVMLIFTFAISMLLRFSHHQIFLFIVDLLHMFELNQPLVFPAAPLFTVILALVGMETIMSEVFADTTTAFYVILIVWIADQYDAICCHSHVSKRYWLRFFYLYQFFFYAYQYRFGGQYGGMALLTSTAFIFHSMVFFFHHYEMPLILYQDRLQRILTEIDTAPVRFCRHISCAYTCVIFIQECY
ncbi:unnamed protein product [Angiostrongylus costaricensis]|uniref:Membralin n=1 Tax=Angiostrongylus costaricensis TaxID=334426 RepID=A0A0R3PSU7_ANGCS|nr:unnamed protein product [Angiostrongylus costaricensis]